MEVVADDVGLLTGHIRAGIHGVLRVGHALAVLVAVERVAVDDLVGGVGGAAGTVTFAVAVAVLARLRNL